MKNTEKLIVVRLYGTADKYRAVCFDIEGTKEDMYKLAEEKGFGGGVEESIKLAGKTFYKKL